MQATSLIDEAGNVRESGFMGCVPWWSFSKTVLAAAVLRLAEAGHLELDKGFMDEPYTPRQLLRHEAGLPDYGELAEYHAAVAAGDAPWPIERLLSAADAGRLRYKPGAAWAYSNIGYLKIAQIIERVSGMMLGAALFRLVFEPLKLESARLATQASDLDDVEMGSASNYHPGWVYHGLVVGTVSDACRVMWAIAHDRLLRPGTVREILEGRALPQFATAMNPDPAYGLGLMQSANQPRSAPFGHRGDGPGSVIVVYAQGLRAAGVWASHRSAADIDLQTRSLLS